ncbi:DUF1800 domain-containing protein [Mucilaginibacter phyllosphaerae]|uniref:DUF1800 domain-containing protein n=1 Tax=Mucilaginibacter phyllosphaerae TaxID=1812349 RepID=A0A4Y8ADN9_9SPHI|nr:DUF1800 domain-containing protein [Mucilaginibacter phyllosphaerae]MBB3970388.1 uncharacterized protein (DUF1800 family) [Mucilaginibacter phyllosphaerae]TEW66754.1 DUF1800 domain-containing protein [Mucilaginibacter phyllosphaerae]GGH11701.1 hypothetical protein GCM10007352_18090 [Mucilaginibacter phyllosphaerae]
MSDINKIKHLYARAGFGLGFADLKQVQNLTIGQAIDRVFQASAAVKPLTPIASYLDSNNVAKGDKMAKQQFLQEERQQQVQLNVGWIEKMSTDDSQLREKMTLFWHNHFACRTRSPWYSQQLNNIHRANALGDFKVMLTQVSQSPAMLQFLNNQLNKKDHPNENFARELMELFTVGRGNYTEQDVKESARAFTGWGYNNLGNFVARDGIHDTGQKTFLGKTGNFTGDDIITMLLERKETAQFICTKLYKYLVNEKPNAANINAMADVFYTSNYNIQKVLSFVFKSDWFYNDSNTGNLIKAPVDLIVGLNRQFYVKYNNPSVLMQFERTLGQVLFNPPNVAGWPGGQNWIDSSLLMYRLKTPSILLNNGIIDFSGKPDPEDEVFLAGNAKRSTTASAQAQTVAGWDKFLADIPAGTSKTQIAQTLLSPKLNTYVMAVVNRANDVKGMVSELVSTPEYQLY